jgi:ATP-binding cassette subfamily B protein
MRFYEPSAGGITIDGVDISELARHDLRSVFGMVLQETWLFNGSIRDNICYGRDEMSEEELLAAARSARIDHFVNTFDEGYDTILNEDASNISQGQKQLITIARAMIANPAILILDEATSSVDTRTEAVIQQAISNLLRDRTSFVIAHRLSTIRSADLILVMKNGDVVEQGTHESLMELGGLYAELYLSQFERS